MNSNFSDGDTVSHKAKEEAHNAKKSIFILAIIFLASSFAMFYVYLNFPDLQEYVKVLEHYSFYNDFLFFFRSEKKHIKIPMDIQDAKMLGKVLEQYKELYYFEVMFAVILVYILYVHFVILFYHFQFKRKLIYDLIACRHLQFQVPYFYPF